jgi:hypothetical protein
MKTEKSTEKICGNCRLYNNEKNECKVAILVEGKEYHMPVFPKDSCHLEELKIPIEQVRWWVEDEKGNPTDKNGTVKIEYPKGFFGNKE